VTLALQQQAEQIEESPTDVRQLLFYASTLRAAGQYDKALEMFERARELSPTRPHILLQMGEVYVAQKKYQEAFEIFKKGYELEP
ncbi:MAG: tetratricopeptide repeat protein, partial [Phycisphaerae bacterium]|nr:tetratricopeptide repeat protein [candidate division KSB1 bacterium]NIT72492.1 tetratricopeptide repeat protein [candidate division KSB1 bacterium]NIV01370.1 tetratricopeptide repeat protein [Phycisphaerae bacterium]NIW70632.1 tetratricopeptide repeat protein [candidate division KSB1 bacterium]NIX72172.1 tetratricopeptide repeat protein [candidate division KSB1 bacterium]